VPPEKQKGGPKAAFREIWCLLGSLECDVHHATTATGAEFDLAGAEREQGVVATTTNALTGVEVGATLADEDLACVDLLAAEPLHAEALRVRVATVTGG
jgi:hypothetical protein